MSTKTLTLLCAATEVEARACRRGLSGDAAFEVLRTGIGPERAARSLEARLARGKRPDEIVSTGFAGGRVSHLDVGTWILVQELHEDEGETLRLDVDAWKTRLGRAGLPFTLASLRTLARIADDNFVSATCDAVDMESAPLARVACGHGVPFSVLRLVSDTPSRPIPRSIIELTTRSQLLGLVSMARSPLETARFLRQMLPIPAELARGWGKIAGVCAS